MKRQNGFTMTELMVVVAIVAILLAIGVPSFRYVTNANRMTAEVNGLLGDLMFARGEAIKQGLPVVVCPSADNQTCANVTTWESGWIICVDANANGTCDVGESVLRVQRSFASNNDQLRPDATSNATAIAFGREGFASGLGAGATFTLHSTPSNSVWTRCLQITAIGMLTATNHVSDATCI
jgi:type IV fimbrial biogenesis protein FimT